VTNMMMFQEPRRMNAGVNLHIHNVPHASSLMTMILPVRRTISCRLVSVCHMSGFYQNGWMDRAVFGMEASFHL